MDVLTNPNYEKNKLKKWSVTHGEAGRDLESTDDESRFGSVDSDASNRENIVDAGLAGSLSWNDDSRHGL